MELKEIKKNEYRLNDKQVLRKEETGYRIIYPVKTDGKINWTNLVRINWTILILLIALLAVMYNAKVNIQECVDILNDPDEFCSNVDYFDYIIQKENYNGSITIEDDKQVSSRNSP